MEYAHGEEKDEQAVAYALEGGVDPDDHAPYLPALEALRRGGEERPYLGQLLVPYAESVLQTAYDPVITYALHPLCE